MNTNKHIPTGIKALDAATSGLEIGRLTFVASRPSQGKTAFLVNVAANTAVYQCVPTAFFSIEIGKQNLFERLLGKMCHIKIAQLRNGYFSQEKYQQLIQPALDNLQKAPLYIDDTTAISIDEICQRTRRLYKELSKTDARLKLVAIDYFQLMKDSQTEANRILAQLRELAHKLEIALAISVQCKRQKANIQPSLSDIHLPTLDIQKEDKIVFLYGNTNDKINLSLYTGTQKTDTLQIPFNKECGNMQ